MFLRIHKSEALAGRNQSALQNAKLFIDHAKSLTRNKPENAATFLCGNAGIYATSAIIHQHIGDAQSAQHDLVKFRSGIQAPFDRNGCYEILLGTAGFLSGIYWLNQNLPAEQRMSPEIISNLSDIIIEGGIQYSQEHKLKIPMMWECYGDKYLGAAHGVSAILHMLLESPMFGGDLQQLSHKQQLVKDTIDCFLQTQSRDGNFPTVWEDAGKSEHKLVHWCHGAPGAIYLFAKAFLIFKDQKYLDACLRCGDLVWIKGLLRKGPGLCHGVAGNGYVFLLLHRLTSDPKHLYRAMKFAEFLTCEEFLREAKTPDHPLSLYEGIAGTVMFLVDLLEPEKAAFPFMDVLDKKF